MTDTEIFPQEQLLEAALSHVAFDGWTETTFRAAVADTGMDPVMARALFPWRGGSGAGLPPAR